MYSPNDYGIFLKEIKTPKGLFCWQYKNNNNIICEHFNNEGGYPKCEEGFYLDRKNETPIGTLKDIKCFNLKEKK
jgi:hypothetical protein